MPRWPRSASSSARTAGSSTRRMRRNGIIDRPLSLRGKRSNLVPQMHAGREIASSRSAPRNDGSPQEAAMIFVEAKGAKIPAVGLGTWEMRGRACARVVEQALRLGYRHIDTAEMYDNEREVGEGLHASRSEERRVGKECRSRWSTYN